MTLVLDLNPAQQHALQTSAAREGIAVDEYALRQLFPTVSPAGTGEKPFRASEFAGIAPTGRTAEEIDAEIRAMRDEWDDSEEKRVALATIPALSTLPSGLL